jgi:fluoride exporter
MTWWLWVLVGVAGAAGAPLRYVIDTLVTDRSERRVGPFPLGTLVVNLSGSLILGFITGLVMYHGLTKAPKAIFGTGFIGAYTTFSTFGYETVALLEDGYPRAALTNLAASLALGLAAAAAGLALGSL